MNELKVFSTAEANSLLPVLTQLIEKLQRKKNEVNQLEVEIDVLELVHSDSKHSSHEIESLVKKHKKAVSDFYSCVDQIHSYKCFLKDVDMGLIDFYGVIEGRVVYLCWKLGEDQIRFWHEIGEGFANRALISDAEGPFE